MKPQYEEYKNIRPTEIVSVRSPKESLNLLRIIASAEGDTVAGLLIGGLARVIEDRAKDPEFILKLAEIKTSIDEKIEIFQNYVDTMLGA
jgi:hypothetical protein